MIKDLTLISVIGISDNKKNETAKIIDSIKRSKINLKLMSSEDIRTADTCAK